MRHRSSKHRSFITFATMIAVVSLAVAACGSDEPSQAATAEPGSEFCDLSQEARDIGDAIDPTTATPDELEEQVAEAVAASRAAAEAAPKDFEEQAEDAVESQEKFVELLEEYDYVYLSAFTSPEGQEFFNDPGLTELQDERNEYLLDKCEIEQTENTFEGDLTISDGDEGIRQVFQLLQFNDAFSITDEQIDCAVDELSGKITDEDLQAIANQTEVSEEGKQNFGLAVLACGIELPGS